MLALTTPQCENIVQSVGKPVVKGCQCSKIKSLDIVLVKDRKHQTPCHRETVWSGTGYHERQGIGEHVKSPDGVCLVCSPSVCNNNQSIIVLLQLPPRLSFPLIIHLEWRQLMQFPSNKIQLIDHIGHCAWLHKRIIPRQRIPLNVRERQ